MVLSFAKQEKETWLSFEIATIMVAKQKEVEDASSYKTWFPQLIFLKNHLLLESKFESSFLFSDLDFGMPRGIPKALEDWLIGGQLNSCEGKQRVPPSSCRPGSVTPPP